MFVGLAAGQKSFVPGMIFSNDAVEVAASLHSRS